MMRKNQQTPMTQAEQQASSPQTAQSERCNKSTRCASPAQTPQTPERFATQNKKTLSWIWKVCGTSKIAVAVLLCIQIALGIISVSYALALRSIVDEAVAGNEPGFWQAVVVLVFLMIAQIALSAVVRWLSERTRSTLENRCKQKLFSTLLGKDYAEVSAIHSGEWMNRLTSDTVVVANGIVDIIPNVGGMATRIIGAVCALLIMEPIFGYAIVPCGILLVVLTWAFRKVLKRLHKHIQQTDGRFRIFAQEHLENLLIVRSFTIEQQAQNAAEQRMDDHRAARMKRMRFSNLCNIGFATLMQGAYVAAAIYCGWSILAGVMTYGTFIAVLQLVGQVQSPFANITGYLPRWYATCASAERIMEAEVFTDDIANTTEAVKNIDELKRFYHEDFKALGLRDVSFDYSESLHQSRNVSNPAIAPVSASPANASTDTPINAPTSTTVSTFASAPSRKPLVLDDFSLELCKGDYMALMGPSGQGKSTILKLLLSLYTPQKGKCYVRTSNSEQTLDATWRGLFAYVPQGNQLLSGTIRSCIAFGDENRAQDDEKLMYALDIACMRDVIQALDKGLDTELGERGEGFSEGQIQRLAIARAIFSERPILLLDEATSSLDAQTEHALLQNLHAMTDRTVLLVTHRESVLSICNKHIRMQ